jgi:hypothetical protein
MATKKKMLQAAAGNAGGAAPDVDDVFSTYLYEGNGSTQTITNNVDLSGEGGLVWIKSRAWSYPHGLFDTERGATKQLISSSTVAERTLSTLLTSFNNNGFSLGSDSDVNGTYSTAKYASWTFRKAPKFFDVVTYTGNGPSNTQNISHNLGTDVGMLVVKATSTADNWHTWHRGFGDNGYIMLNATNAKSTYADLWDDTAPTSTHFTVSDSCNTNNVTYVAYLFAHNNGDGDFGPDGSDIIKCGSYTGNGSDDGPVIDLGFEPQWLMIKNTTDADSWWMFDTMRGMAVDAIDPALWADGSNAEVSTGEPGISPTPTGFKVTTNQGFLNNNNSNLIYISIRRGPLAPPTAGTEVFGIDNNTGQTGMTTGVVTDFGFAGQRSGTDKYYVGTRLLQGSYLNFNSTASESSSSAFSFDQMDGFFSAAGSWNGYIGYGWKRAPSYMDCVAFSGNGSYPRNISHNLGVVPEMMWVKTRNATDHWRVYSKDMTVQQEMLLNGTYAASATGSWGTGGRPTDSVFIVGSANTNYSGRNYIAYLFASLDGISKVGSYTGNGSFQTIDCGFSAGSRFVLIKRTDATGDWYVWDSERGITQAADPYLELNTTAAETTGNKNYLYPANSGFGVQEINGTNNPNINVSGATYIFYAIA